MASSQSSEDVKMLFRRFGGEVNTYQEVVRERNAEASRVKWPMLNSVEPLQALNAPSVHQTVRTAKVRHAVEEPRPTLAPAPPIAPVTPLPASRAAAHAAPVAASPGPLRRLGAASSFDPPTPAPRTGPAHTPHPAPPALAPKAAPASGLAGRWASAAQPPAALVSAAPMPAPDSLSGLFSRISNAGAPAAATAPKSLFKDRLK